MWNNMCYKYEIIYNYMYFMMKYEIIYVFYDEIWILWVGVIPIWVYWILKMIIWVDVDYIII